MAKTKKISPFDLTKTVEDMLAKYGDEVYGVVEVCVEEIAEEAKNRLKQETHFRRDSFKYPASWVNEKLQSKRFTVKHAVHNVEHYRLTHLLEKGHVVRNGTGRNEGKQRTDAFPHIAPVNDWVNKELPDMVKRKIEK